MGECCNCLVPFTFWIVTFGEYNIKGFLGDVGILLIACCLIELTEGNNGKGIGEDVVGFHEWMALSVQRKVPVQLPIVAVFLQELGALYGSIQPLLSDPLQLPLYGESVIEFGEHPNFAALKPDELVGVIDLAVSLDAGEVPTELFVYTVLHPEGHHPVQQFALILSGQIPKKRGPLHLPLWGSAVIGSFHDMIIFMVSITLSMFVSTSLLVNLIT